MIVYQEDTQYLQVQDRYGEEVEERNPFVELNIRLIDLKDFVKKAFKNIGREIKQLQAQVYIVNNGILFLTAYIESETKFITNQAETHHGIQYNAIKNAITILKNIESDMGIAFTQLAYSKLNSLLFKYDTYEAKYEEPVEYSFLRELCDLLEDVIINPPMINYTTRNSVVKFYVPSCRSVGKSSGVTDIVIVDSLLKVYIKVRIEMKKRNPDAVYDRKKIMFNKLCEIIDRYNLQLNEDEFNRIKQMNIKAIDKLLAKYKLIQRCVYRPLAYVDYVFGNIGGCTNYSHCRVVDTGMNCQPQVNGAIDHLNHNQLVYVKPIAGNCMLYMHPMEFKYTHPKIKQLFIAKNAGVCDFQLFYKLDLHKTDLIGTVDDHHPNSPKIICKKGGG